MALEVDDVVAAERELQQAGLSWVGPIQEVQVGPWMVKMVCCHDPDGSLIELTEFPYGQRRGRRGGD
jgi:catechol 2,3-dioxygenase-like lactoylglutathione lyase family enzyme